MTTHGRAGTAPPSLRARAVRGAAWSGVNTIVFRLGGVVVGIVLARILTPEQFGVYAVALTVQAILMTVADLGLSADIIRSDDPDRIIPTVATLGLVSGGVLTIVAVSASGALADLLGSAAAAPAIAVLGVTLVLGGATVVPYGLLLRRFQQRELFVVSAVDFVVSTTVTLGLVAAGWGVLALAIGRLASQSASSILLFVFARQRPRFGIDRAVIGPVLAFGLPIAAANMLSWTLLNIDNVVLARVAGATALGFYVLAFNISSWPMSALAQVLRSVSLPYFARTGQSVEGLANVTGIAWAAALPAGACLAVLSAPLVEVVYGEKWLPAAAVLAALGLYGGCRVVFDVFAGYLYAQGRSRPVLWVQVLWLIVLAGGMLLATPAWGIVGAGWVHVVVAVAVILPAYLLALRTTAVPIRPLLAATWVPTLSVIPAVVVGVVLDHVLTGPVLRLLLGGVAFVVVYAVIAGPWLLRRVRVVRRATPGDDEP